jgi:hypothetical protein
VATIKVFSNQLNLSMTIVNKFVCPAAAIAFLFFGQANAKVIVDNRPLCDVGSVTLADVSPSVYKNADACIGYLPKQGSTAAETALLDTRTDGGDWTFVYKVAEGEKEGPGVFAGIGIELTGVDLGATQGSWALTWWDTNGDAEANLPLTVDIAAAFKAGTSIAYFLFEGIELSAPEIEGEPITRLGSFFLEVKNSLSHESLFVRRAKEPEDLEELLIPQGQTPVPGTLLLLAAPLLGFAARRRRGT